MSEKMNNQSILSTGGAGEQAFVVDGPTKRRKYEQIDFCS